jgi:hypothetical protein
VRTFSEYLAARETNRQIASEAMPYLTKVFDTSLSAMDRLGLQFATYKDRNGKSHVSLVPFFLIFQRQVTAAFDALSANQAYIAWTVVRSGIESVLIMGKWVEDKANADIWQNRTQNKKAYRAAYEGPALRSKALPNSERIQIALSKINDHFLHPNPSYYFRHLEFNELNSKDVELVLNFFDDSDDVAVGILGVLHLVILAQDSVSRMLDDLFPEAPFVDVGLSSFEEQSLDWARSASRTAYGLNMLVELGAWPAHVLRPSPDAP